MVDCIINLYKLIIQSTKKFLFIIERKNMSVSYIVDNLEINFIIILFLLLIFASFTGQERYKDNKKLNIFTVILLIIFLPKLQYQFVHFLSFLPKYQNLT